MVTAEALRLHLIHCEGCSEYTKHGAEWTIQSDRRVSGHEGNEGFDSPPAPPITDSDKESQDGTRKL